MEPPCGQRGTSFIELMVAISIVGVAVLVMLQQLTISHHEAEANRDRVFAYQKGLAILNELQAAVERGAIKTASQLELLAESSDSFVLTTLRDEHGEPLPPDHASSGNTRRDDEWIWSRRVEVSPHNGNPRLRQVQVSVRRVGASGHPRRTFASLATILNLPNESGPTVQDFDLYALALNAVPSTYMVLPSLRSAFEAAIDEITQRAPGLRFRVHWITELGYGRDRGYMPYLNTARGATAAAPYAYWYPSKCDQVLPALFAPDNFGARVRTDAGVLHDYDSIGNPWPFAVADQFNHAVRLEEARKLFAARVAAGLADRGEPPLQLLLQDMHDQPDRYRNAILVNLHGEILPFPPLRNYSDPAREPLFQPGVRVVTHPARLRSIRDPNADGNADDSQPLELRVYAFKDDPNAGSACMSTPITLRIFGVDLTASVNGSDPGQPSTLEIRRLCGGVDVDSGGASSVVVYQGFETPLANPPLLTTRTHPHEMAYECGFVASPEPYTWIRLHDTPLGATPVDTRGLFPTSRLYGLDYIPSPVAAPVDENEFPLDLASDGLGPKNTARWRIRIPPAVFVPGFPGGGLANADQVIRVDTRLGVDTSTGESWPVPNQPLNRSITWAWWAHDPEAVPLTERYQFQGDPRHNPYADLCATGTSFANGYDWYFDDLRVPGIDASGDWPCLDGERLRDGFGPGVFFDVPRVAQVWRAALLHSDSLMVSFGGRFAGTVSLGGDICLPGDAGDVDPHPVPTHGAFYGITGYAAVDSLTILDPNNPAAPGPPATIPRIGAVFVTDQSGTAIVRPWLGELCPESAAGVWNTLGNLPTSPVSGGFHRVPRQESAPAPVPGGTDLTLPGGGRIGALGAATLLQAGTSSSTFAQRIEPMGATAVPVDPLRDLFLAASIGLPEQSPIRFTHGLSETLPNPMPHLVWANDYPDHFCQELERLARGPDLRSAAGVLRLTSPDGREHAYFAVDGTAPNGSLTQQDLLRSTVLFALHGLWVASHPAFDNDIALIPRVLVTAPEQGTKLKDPTAIQLRWRTTFERFDGARYTSTFPEFVAGDEGNLRYRVSFSSDGGTTWHDPESGSTVDPLDRGGAESLIADSGFGDENLALALPPELFAPGDYLFRIVAHHAHRESHIAWHDVYVQIARAELLGGSGGTGK